MTNWIRMSLFFLVASTVILGMHLVIYRHIKIAFQITPNTLWFKLLIAFSAIWYISSMFLGRWKPNVVTETSFTLASYWLGISTYLFLFGLVGELIGGVLALVRIEHISGVDWSVWRRWIAISTLTASGILSIWAILVASGPFTIHRTEFRTKKLDPALDGFRIVQISDIHIGAVNRSGFAQKVAKAVSDLKPDLVLIPGDIADGDRFHLAERLAPLGTIAAKYGVFWSTGNHEYYTGQGLVVEAMSRCGIPVLRNSAFPIADGRIIVAGVNDPTDRQMGGEGTRIDFALKGIDTSKPIILMSHQPRLFRESFQLGADIMVSGHTHGGQFWPFNYIVDRVWEVPRGFHREGNAMLSVSVGIGTWGPPMRLSQPPEIVEITLRSDR